MTASRPVIVSSPLSSSSSPKDSSSEVGNDHPSAGENVWVSTAAGDVEDCPGSGEGEVNKALRAAASAVGSPARANRAGVNWASANGVGANGVGASAAGTGVDAGSIDVEEHEQSHAAEFDHLTWGEVDGETLAQAINSARAECVHWRRNVFSVPSGSSEKSFVRELVRLLSMFNDETPWKSIALTALFTFPNSCCRSPGHNQQRKSMHLVWSAALWRGMLEMLTFGPRTASSATAHAFDWFQRKPRRHGRSREEIC